MFGANATATPGGYLLQLRALDWNVDGVLTYPINNRLYHIYYYMCRTIQELPSNHCVSSTLGLCLC